MISPLVKIRWLLPVLVFLILTASLNAATSQDCFDCHSDPDIISEVKPPNPKLHIEKSRFYNSAHGKKSCTSCHTDAKAEEHETPLKPVNCSVCHRSAVKDYLASDHHKAALAKNPDAPTCITCHGGHEMLPASNLSAPTFALNTPFLCGQCHQEGVNRAKQQKISRKNIEQNYTMGVHGEGFFKKGLKVTAGCASCHTSHKVLPEDDPRSSIHRKNISRTCMQCHANIEKVHLHVIKGKLWKQSHLMPVCTDCHSDHKIKAKPNIISFENAFCITCHPANNLSHTNINDTASSPMRETGWEGTAHLGISCVKCHVDMHMSRNPVCKDTRKVDCASCHQEAANNYHTSIHGQMHEQGDKDAPSCLECHGTHAIKSKADTSSPIYRAHIGHLCSQCHRYGQKAAIRIKTQFNLVEKYDQSVHGQALEKRGLLVTAICTDCHTSHHELPASDSASSINQHNLAVTCARCHRGINEKFRRSIHSPEYNNMNNTNQGKTLPACNICHSSHTIMRTDKDNFRVNILEQCGSCHPKTAKTYFSTYHGKVTKFGPTKTARCSDCHSAHNILPASDSTSSIHSSNIVATCAKCHTNSNKNFAGYFAHADYKDRANYPLVFWPWAIMTTLLVSTLVFFMLHTLLWFFRESVQKVTSRSKHSSTSKHGPGRYFQRYSIWHQVTHLLVVISFLGLAATGLPLKYSNSGWAQEFMHFIGGYHTAGFLHRVCAVLTLVYVLLHFGGLILNFRKMKVKFSWEAMFGPNSMLPRPKDFQDLYNHFRWFLFLGPRPRFDRWTYWDKADYWGEFWGVAVIGSSGLLLWFPSFFSLFMPGWMFNVATVIHSIEALLAACIIFLVHFFNVHLRPSKFPMDPVIFSGNISEEEFKEEHPLEYDRLAASGELQKLEKPKTGRRMYVAIRIFGFSAFSFGIFLVLVIIYTELSSMFN